MSLAVTERQEIRFQRGFKTWAENTAVSIRKNLGSSAHDPLVPVDLATYLDVRVWTPHDVPGLRTEALQHLLSAEGDEWSALTVRVGNREVIVLNPGHSSARQASDLTHELAHIIRDHTPAQILISNETGVGLRTFDELQESEANWLAGCLLLPRTALAHCANKRMSCDGMREYFGVSAELLRYRLNVSGIARQYGAYC